MTQIIFWFLSAVSVFSAIMVITRKNPVYSVLYLIITFFAISGHYILMNAQFLAIVNIIVYAGAIMVLFLFVGKEFLRVLGLDVRSFAVAGSIVIFILGLEMVLGLEFFKPDKNAKSGSVVPIAFPLIAGSGTLTTIMSLKANYADINILTGILINCIVIYLVLKSLKWIENFLGPNGMTIIRKFFGVILLAIAVKIFGTNIQGFGK